MAKKKPKVLEVVKSQAIALFIALGFGTAKKWKLDKLTEKINAIEEAPDEPLEDEELDELLDNLLEAPEAVVVEDEEEEEDDDDSDDDSEDDSDDDDDSNDDDDDDDDDDEEEKPKKKDKKGKDKKKDKKGKDKKKDKKEKPKKKKGKSIDQATLELLQKKPIKFDALLAALCKQFPENDEDTLKRTTRRRLTGHLQNKFGVKILKSKKGAYSVEEE
jgi:outer membrane biosynthesis protein TonB